MRQSKFIAVQSAPNCYRTVAVDKGIIQYYSVCVGNTVDLNIVSQWYGCSRDGYINLSDDNNRTNISVYRIVDIRREFKKIPYKQCYPKVYTQDFKFIIIRVFNSWNEVSGRGGLDETFKFNSALVREFVLNLKKETNYYK
jgi:hypothetical protein